MTQTFTVTGKYDKTMTHNHQPESDARGACHNLTRDN